MPFLIEVETAEDESVTFVAAPGKEIEESCKYIEEGYHVHIEHLTDEELARHKEKLELETVFQGDDIPW